jgi:hypothetical protein
VYWSGIAETVHSDAAFGNVSKFIEQSGDSAIFVPSSGSHRRSGKYADGVVDDLNARTMQGVASSSKASTTVTGPCALL